MCGLCIPYSLNNWEDLANFYYIARVYFLKISLYFIIIQIYITIFNAVIHTVVLIINHVTHATCFTQLSFKIFSTFEHTKTSNNYSFCLILRTLYYIILRFPGISVLNYFRDNVGGFCFRGGLPFTILWQSS